MKILNTQPEKIYLPNTQGSFSKIFKANSSLDKVIVLIVALILSPYTLLKDSVYFLNSQFRKPPSKMDSHTLGNVKIKLPTFTKKHLSTIIKVTVATSLIMGIVYAYPGILSSSTSSSKNLQFNIKNPILAAYYKNLKNYELVHKQCEEFKIYLKKTIKNKNIASNFNEVREKFHKLIIDAVHGALTYQIDIEDKILEINSKVNISPKDKGIINKLEEELKFADMLHKKYIEINHILYSLNPDYVSIESTINSLSC